MKKKTYIWEMIPAVLAIAVVPLIVCAYKYSSGLGVEPWFSDNDITYDFYLYYKSKALLVIGILLLAVILWRMLRKDFGNLTQKVFQFVLAALGAYLLFSLISVFFAENFSFAFWGGHEQWEGFMVLFVYGLLFFTIAAFATVESCIHLLMGALTIGSLIVGGLGFFQWLGYDFMLSSGMLPIVNLMDSTLKITGLRLTFDEKVAYSSLYNPNYVGSYVVLVLPMLVAVVLFSRHVWQKILAVLSLIVNLCALYSSQSFMGLLGVAAAIFFLLLFMIPRIIKRAGKRAWISIGAVLFLVLAVCLVNLGTIRNLVATMTDTALTSREEKIENMDMQKNELSIYQTNGKKAVCTFHYDNRFSYEIKDDNGQDIACSYNGETGALQFTQEGYESIQFIPTLISCQGRQYPAVEMRVGEQTWSILWDNGELAYLNLYQAKTKLRYIEQFGFKGNMAFGSNRGYIWSRTLPLLKYHLLVGCGQDNFVYEFPNDDYVAHQSYDLAGRVRTRPHNLYLQVWVQNGMIAFLGFFAVCITYIVLVSRRFLFQKAESYPAKVAIAAMFSIAGYLVTSLGNDQMVTFAPVYWGILGIGYASYFLADRTERATAKGR